MIYLIPKLILKKDKNTFYILILILSLWLPYIFIGRIMFMYHYFPVTPFMMLSLVMLLKDVSEKFKVKYLIPIYMILVVAFFIIYYPVITGNIVEINDLEKLKIFNSWYF